MVVDWAYKRDRRERKKNSAKTVEHEEPMQLDEAIDEKLLLEWEETKPPKDLLEEVVEEEKELGVEETLLGLSDMILLLSQMQTLRVAAGKTDIPDDEKVLGMCPSIFQY